MRPKVMAQRRRRRKSEPLDLASSYILSLQASRTLLFSWTCFHMQHAFTCNMTLFQNASALLWPVVLEQRGW